MQAIGTLVLLSAMFGGSQTELIYFTMDGCVPCQSMKTTVARLTQEGYPIRTLNITQDPSIASRYGISRVPSFVTVVNGQITATRTGVQHYETLLKMMPQVAQAAPSVTSQVAYQASSQQQRPIQARITQAGFADTRNANRTNAPSQLAPNRIPNDGNVAATRLQGMTAEELAMQASVRIKIKDSTGISYGTGTVIHRHGEEALILTCGHVFRDSQGKGQVTIEYGFPNQIRSSEGQVLQFDSDTRDVGLVVFRPTLDIVAVTPAPPSAEPIVQSNAFSVGCDHGNNPTIRRTQIKAIANYSGIVKYDIFGRPAVGRSGGGLFNAQGQLIGVCNAAAVKVDEGIYAGLNPIYWQLEKANLAHQFNQPNPVATTLVANNPSANNFIAANVQTPGATITQVGSNQPAVNFQHGAPVQVANQSTQSPTPVQNTNEIICVVRSRENPHLSETIVLTNPTQELLNMIRQNQNLGNGQTLSSSNNSVPSRVAAPIVRRDNYPYRAQSPN